MRVRDCIHFMNSKSKTSLWLILLCSFLTGCRTFNYTEADLERERRQASGFGTERCPNACWHEAHGFQPGYPIKSGARYGP